MKRTIDILIARYEQLLAQAEAKGISVWDKKAELIKLKKSLVDTAPEKDPDPAPKVEKTEPSDFEKRLKVTKDEDTTLPDGKKTKPNEDRDLNVPLAPLDPKWLEAGGIAKEDQPHD
jgi:hypothetical protein